MIYVSRFLRVTSKSWTIFLHVISNSRTIPFSILLNLISETIRRTCHDSAFVFQRVVSDSRNHIIFSIVRHLSSFRNDTNQSYRQDSRLSIRENGDEGGRWDLEEAYPSVFEDALESRRSLAVNVERQIAAARSKDGGSKRWRESFQPCARLT